MDQNTNNTPENPLQPDKLPDNTPPPSIANPEPNQPNVITPGSASDPGAGSYTPPSAFRPVIGDFETPAPGAAPVVPGGAQMAGPPDPSTFFQPASPQSPAVGPPNAVAPALPEPQPTGLGGPAAAAPNAPVKRSWKLPLIGLAVLLVVIIGSLGYYFGYYMNSSVILLQSLSNTGKGYSTLADYVSQQSQLGYKGAVGSGSYKFNIGGTSSDGKLGFKSDGTNSDTTFDIGVGITRVNAEVRTIKSAGNTPDIYLKASGIKGLGSFTGSPQIDNAVNQLDGKWIVVDHTLIDNLESQAASLQSDLGQSQKAAASLPSKAEILDEAKSFGQVNQQYVFTTDKSKSITTVLKKYGVETIDGHKVYHYKMGFNKANVKAYITAQRDALKANSLGAWLQKNNDMDGVNATYSSLEKSANSIKSTDTFDLWSDVSHRIVYKVRVSDRVNPAVNYVDIGLDYKGGSQYPFFVSGQSDGKATGKGTYAILATLDEAKNSLNVEVKAKSSGQTSGTFSLNFTFQPSNAPVKVTAPTGAESLSQVLDQLGLTNAINELLSPGATSATPVVPTTPSNTILQ